MYKIYHIAGYFQGRKFLRFSLNKVYEIFWHLSFGGFKTFINTTACTLLNWRNLFWRFCSIRENLHPAKITRYTVLW